MIIMSGGFSSRSTTVYLKQFPQRDEAMMNEDEPGFSNSDPVANDDEAVKDEQAEAESKVVKPAVKKTASKKD